MTIANVTLNNTFDEWRAVTNQLITFVNEVDTQQLINAVSNTAVLTVTPTNIPRNQTLYITLNVSSDVLDTATLNVATANAVNIVFAALANTDARLVLVSDDANTINAVANAAMVQANVSRLQANTGRDHANVAFLQANVARTHANTAHASANAGLLQANTARVHANAAFFQANTAYDIAVALSGNTIPTLQANKAAFDNSNSAYEQANTARVHANAAFANANTVMISAQVSFTVANSSFIHANAMGAIANSGFDQANTARVHANVSFEQANTARVHANVSFEQANTARVHANTAHASANAGLEQANTARVHANTAHASANAGLLQANTARVHANTAHASANAGLLQANTARVHANASYAFANSSHLVANLAFIHANNAYEQANAALPNTSGVAFVGNLQIPAGNLTIGEGTTRGIRLYVNSYIGVANVIPQSEFFNGSQSIKINANTSGGAWNDLMSPRDASIIFSRGSSDDGANLIIGPWTDSSFGYKQDNAGRHGFNTLNPRQVLDANGSANISGSLLVWNTRNDQPMNVVATITASFAKANTIGTLGTQSSSSVSISGGSISGTTITGGSVSGITDLAIADGGTGSSTAAGARTNLGLGDMATQVSSGVTISGGTITGITDLRLADGGTGASLTAAAGAVAYSTAAALALSAVGSTGQVLVSNGASAPTWENLIPAGTIMLFGQTTAPLGWTKLTTHNDKALRVVSGAVGSGGTLSFSSAFANRGASGTTGATGVSGTTGTTGVAAYTDFRQVSGSVDYHVLSWNEMPVHSHNITYGTNDVNSGGSQYPAYFNRTGLNKSSDNAGANWGHNHGFVGGSHQHYFDAGAHSHSFNAGTHTHSFSTSIDMTVQYVDVIMASKDVY